MLNSGSETLDKILQSGRVTGDMSGMGYNGTNKSSIEPAQIQAESKMSNQMFTHHRRNNYKQPNRGPQH